MPLLPVSTRWDGGIREDLPRGAIAPPFCEVGDNVEFDSTTGPAKRPGFKRITTSLPDPAGLRMDGVSNVLLGNPNASGGSNLVLSGDWTVGIGFALHRFTVGGNDYLWGYEDGDIYSNLIIRTVQTNPREYHIMAVIGDGTNSRTVESTATSLKLGVYYHVRVSFNSTTKILSIYLDGVDSSWTDAGTALPGTQYTPAASRWVVIGGRDSPDSDLQSTRSSRFKSLSQVDIHRLRRWNSLKAETSASTQFDYHMAEMSGYAFSDSDGNGPDLKLAQGSQDPGTTEPSLRVFPHVSNADWETSSSIAGDGSLSLNGFSQFFRIDNAYLMKRPFSGYSTGDTSVVWQDPKQFGLAIIVKPASVSQCVLAHLAPVRTTTTNCRVTGGSSQQYYWALGIDSSDQFFFSVCTSAGSAITVTSSSVTASADETYLIHAFRSTEDTVMRLKVCVLSTGTDDWDEEVENAAASGTQLSAVSGFDDRDLRAWKYACVLGGEIRQTLFSQPKDDANDPASFQLAMSYDRLFDGLIDSFCFLSMEQETDGSGDFPDSVLLQLLDGDIRREDINSLSYAYRFLSFFPFNEGSDNATEDWGLNGNHQFFVSEPEKSHVRNQSSLTVSEEAPPKITGVFENFKPATGGSERDLIAIAGGSFYEVDSSTGDLTHVADGFRNDDEIAAVAIPFGRKLLVAAGYRPVQLFGDDVFPLGIEILDISRVRYGFIGQMLDYAEITEGTYYYRLVFYSTWTGEEGEHGGEIKVTVRGDNQTIVGFGALSSDTAYAASIFPNQRHAKLQSVSEPFDLTTGLSDPDDFAASRMDVYIEADSQAATYRVRINRSDVDNPESVTAKEIRDVINDKIAMGSTYTKSGAASGSTPVNSIIIRSNAVGTGSTIRIDHLAVNTGKGYTNLGSILGWTDTQSDTGTAGDASEAPLPVPVRSPQATHIRIYRTLADGGTFYLVDQIPIGSNPLGYPGGSYYLDNISDDDLVTRLPMDDRHGSPPNTKDMVEIDGRVIYADADVPERLWWSVPDRANDVEPFSFMDVLVGRTLEITALERYAGVAMVFKEHATITLIPSTSPIVPFLPELRKPGIGCVGRHALTNVLDSLFIGSSSYPTVYDSLSFKEIGVPVRKTWNTMTNAQRGDVIAIHDSRRRSILFAIPGLEKVLVYNYVKSAWSIWTRFGLTCAQFALEDTSPNQIFFGDQYGMIHLFDDGALSDGGNFIEDDVGESLTGTDFSVSSDEVTITGWSVTSSDDYALRGAKLRLDDDGESVEVVTVLYVTSGGALKVTPAPSSSGGASATWAFCGPEADFLSAEISHGLGNIQVQRLSGELADDSDYPSWPTTHSVTLYSRLSSGVVSPGDIEKEHPVSLSDFIVGLPFQARRFQWGIKNISPNEPFAVNYLALDGELRQRGRAF